MNRNALPAPVYGHNSKILTKTVRTIPSPEIPQHINQRPGVIIRLDAPFVNFHRRWKGCHLSLVGEALEARRVVVQRFVGERYLQLGHGLADAQHPLGKRG